MHPLLPLLLLAGLGVQAIWDARARLAGKLGLALVDRRRRLRGSTPRGRANVENGADPREFLVTTQSSEAVKGVRDEVEAVAAKARREGREPQHRRRLRRRRDVPVGVVLPPPAGVGYPDLTQRAAAVRRRRGADRHRGQPRPAARPSSPGYDGREFPFRVWWVRDYGAMSPGGWWRWFTEREPWNPTGGMPEWLYLRQGAR